MTAAAAQDVGSSWRLRLMDTARQTQAKATLQFTGEPVRSCMRGKWQRMAVTASEGSGPAFFPLAAPLAYKREHGVLTMAQTDACRRIPLLSAMSSARDIHGTYRVVSAGRSKKQGLFSMVSLP
ncbi:MAG TPA: hypothetical protein VF663_09460 [Telluria sp.]